MDIRLRFNEDVENYDKWRPRYCPQLFADIIAYSKIGEGKLAVEMGCGTGQATEPILQTGAEVIAVEYGSELAVYTEKKFKDYDKFKIENIEFEKFVFPDNSVDLIYSATAFHWVPIVIAYPKAFQMLKSGGSLAVFWNRPVPAQQEEKLKAEIQALYQKYLPNNIPTVPLEDDKERKKIIFSAYKSYGFMNLDYNLYKEMRVFSANDYLRLLNTYSDHRSLNPLVKQRFEQDLKTIIDKHGGTINVYDTMDLYLGKKP